MPQCSPSAPSLSLLRWIPGTWPQVGAVVGLWWGWSPFQLQKGSSTVRSVCSLVSAAYSVSAEFPHVHDDGWIGIIIGCK